jgi:Spy/CpxP family protein refolding chaperone
MKRGQWTAILFALLLFLFGAAVGALAHRYYNATVVNAKSATSEDARRHYLSEMETKLNLSADQLSKLEAILDDTKTKARAVREQYRPEMLKIKNEQISRVKAILTPEQIPVYEQLVADRERRMREQEERDRQEELHRKSARLHGLAP